MNVQTRRKFKTNQALSHSTDLSAAEALPFDGRIELGTIDDSASIQRALSLVINAIAAGTLDPARGRILLRGLQIASTNAHRMASRQKTEQSVHVEKKTTGAQRKASSPVIAAVSRPQEPQPIPASQHGQEKPKYEDDEAIANGDRSRVETAGAEAPAQPVTYAAPPAVYSGGVRVPPSCFSPASEYSSGARSFTPLRHALLAQDRSG